MIGLGTMGRNFLLNVAEQGFSSVGFDIDPSKRELLMADAKDLPIETAIDLAEFVSKLSAPRSIMLLVPAGPIVDSVINDLLPHLSSGDLVIDGGNSFYFDTERRETLLNERGFEFLGVGVSGGEEGARRGASIMIGGSPEAYERVRPIFEAASAKVNGEPCAAHVGSGSAGHFVKMVHNGIEYGMMQLIAETYDAIRKLLSVSSDAAVADVFADWNTGELNSFLIEITATVLRKRDAETWNSLVSMILDTAGQKGTGKWTSQAAMDLGIPVPTIDSAVTMRQISAQKQQRVELARKLPASQNPVSAEIGKETLRSALNTAFLLAYAQGFAMLRTASDERGFELDMVEIAKIWRGGCIIRAAMLENIRKAFSAEPGLANLMHSPHFHDLLRTGRQALQKVVAAAAAANIPAMAFAATFNYLSAYSAESLPANLIQAQRDYFGAHTYQRTDQEGTFHTADWES
jgi:6-phosphogluconate dehydrogenase